MTQQQAEAVARSFAAELSLDVLDVDRSHLVEQPTDDDTVTVRVWYVRFRRVGIENVVTSAPYRCIVVDDASGSPTLFL